MCVSSNLQSAKLSSLQKLNDKLRTRFFDKNGMYTHWPYHDCLFPTLITPPTLSSHALTLSLLP